MGISSGNQSGNPLDNIYIYDVPIKTSIVVVFFQPATVDYQRSTKSKTRKVETNEATKQNQNDKALSQTPKSTRNHQAEHGPVSG